jgi:hypothetical protein
MVTEMSSQRKHLPRCAATHSKADITWMSKKVNVFWQDFLKLWNHAQLIKKEPAFLLNRKVHYRVHKSPEPVPILSHMNPINILQPYFPDRLSILIWSFHVRVCFSE